MFVDALFDSSFQDDPLHTRRIALHAFNMMLSVKVTKRGAQQKGCFIFYFILPFIAFKAKLNRIMMYDNDDYYYYSWIVII